MQRFSARQVVLLRERLILYRRVREREERKKISVQSIINDIEKFIASKDDSGRYSSESAIISNSTLRRFLRRESKNISYEVLYQIARFIQSTGLITAADIAKEENNDLGRAIAGDIHYFAIEWSRRIGAAIEGEYITDNRDTRGLVIVHLLVYVVKHPDVIAADLRRWKFERNRAEGEADFLNRVRLSNFDERESIPGEFLLWRNHFLIFIEAQVPGSKCRHRPFLATVILEDNRFVMESERFNYSFYPARDLHDLTESISFCIIANASILLGGKRPSWASFSSQRKADFLREMERFKRKHTMQNNKEIDKMLLNAARKGDAGGIIQALVQGADINTHDLRTGETASHLVARSGSYSAYAALIYDDDLRQKLEDEFLTTYENPGAVAKAWRSAASKLDPLQRDSAGFLAGRQALDRWADCQDPSEKHRLHVLATRIMGLEMDACHRIGLDWRGFIAHAIPPDLAPTLSRPPSDENGQVPLP